MAACSLLSSAAFVPMSVLGLITAPCFYLSAGSIIVSSKTSSEVINVIENVSDKKRTALVLYSAFLGVFGVDRFYRGKVVSGIIKILVLIATIAGGCVSSILMKSSVDIQRFLMNMDPALLILLMYAICLPLFVFVGVDFVFSAFGKARDAKGRLIKEW